MTRLTLTASPVAIEPAGPEHWSQIEEILRSRELPLEGAKEHLGDFLVVVDSGKVLGTAALEVYGQYGLLRSVAVQEAVAGRGLGKQLVKATVTRAESLGFREL